MRTTRPRWTRPTRPGPTRRVAALIAVLTLIAAACGDSDTDPATGSGTSEAPAEPEGSGDADQTTSDETEAGEATSRYTATVRRTEHNVPHITADDLAGASFGYGYAFAEDHLCSLADVVVQVNGEAARWFGPEWTAQDVVYRSIDLMGDAREQFEGQQPQLQEMIRAYAAGYNAYLDETGTEEIPGYCQGADWIRPIDEYDLSAYYKALTLRASLDPVLDYVFEAAPPTTADEEEPETDPAGDEAALGAAFDTLTPEPSELASNAWAIGPDRTADGTTMLVGNPHFPWQGALRFTEVHLTVPGEIDVYGASLLGSPAVNIGFNEDVAWSHTVSAGTRFTAYTLDLVDGDPTSYHYGDEVRSMTSVDVTVDVLDPDTNDTVSETHTVWFSHYGPVLAFPGVGWTDETVITIRDGNADNDEITAQYLAMNTASSMDEFIEAHADNQGIPWVNTIAASADGRIWYADTSATPNLSDEAIAAWEARVETDPFTGIALDNRVVLLDGSDPLFEWVDDPDARDPGLVPFADMPQQERSDFLFNANDSYWIANPAEPITGVSPLHGLAERPLSNRSRMNAVMLGTEDGDSGPDGRYTFDELTASAVANRAFTAEMLLDDVLAWCDAVGTAHAEACAALAGWDGRVDLGSTGAHVWREFIHELDDEVWAEPFDPDDPIGTPSGLVVPADGGGRDPIADAMTLVAERIEQAGFAFDAPLGDLQYADRNGERVPIHGGTGTEGVSNVVGFSGNGTTSEPGIARGERVEDSALTTSGYPVSNGTSFLYALEFTDDGPQAAAFLTYGQTGDPTSPFFVDQTRRFSDKDWRPIRFTEEDVENDPALRTYTVSGG